jgi:hypothetical protein
MFQTFEIADYWQKKHGEKAFEGCFGKVISETEIKTRCLITRLNNFDFSTHGLDEMRRLKKLPRAHTADVQLRTRRSLRRDERILRLVARPQGWAAEKPAISI